MVEMLRLVRRDALPEDSTYFDDGCDVSPSCLACPLPQCRYDYPQGLLTLKSQSNVSQAIRLRDLGCSIRDIADIMETSKRAVYRRLASARRQSADARLYEARENCGIVVLIGDSSHGRA